MTACSATWTTPLASQTLDGQVTGITEWHINADEPVVLDYNIEFKNNPGCTSSSCTTPTCTRPFPTAAAIMTQCSWA